VKDLTEATDPAKAGTTASWPESMAESDVVVSGRFL
jgi:hypothetical protein